MHCFRMLHQMYRQYLHPGINTIVIVVYNNHQIIPSCCIAFRSLHLALDAMRWIKGTKVLYLKKAAAESTSRLSLQEAVITGVHLENGPEHPYYSISLLPTEENGFQQRELQTEWWR